MSADNKDRNRLLGVFLLPILLVGGLIIVAMFILSYQDTAPRAQSSGRFQQLGQATFAKFKNGFDQRGEAIGKGSAPVTIREFGDYQCPACGAFSPVARKIRKQLVKAGKVRYIFFDFPLPMHKNAFQAAIAARCAARQHRFWPYHDALYENQKRWGESNDPVSHFLDIAVETGVKTKPLKQCIRHSKTKPAIEKEKLAGKAIGLRATPTILVGRTMISGGVSYKRIKKLVAQAGSSGS